MVSYPLLFVATYPADDRHSTARNHRDDLMEGEVQARLGAAGEIAAALS